MDKMFHRNIALIARGFNPWIGHGFPGGGTDFHGFPRILGHGLQIRASETSRIHVPLK